MKLYPYGFKMTHAVSNGLIFLSFIIIFYEFAVGLTWACHAEIINTFPCEIIKRVPVIDLHFTDFDQGGEKISKGMVQIHVLRTN